MSAWEGRKPIGGVRKPIGGVKKKAAKTEVKKPETEGCSKHQKEPYPTWLRKPIPMTSKANQTADAKLISELREQIKNKDGQYQKLHWEYQELHWLRLKIKKKDEEYQKLHSLFLTVHSDYQKLGKTHLAMLGGVSKKEEDKL